MEPISTPGEFQQIPAEKSIPRKEHEAKTEFIHHNIIYDKALPESSLKKNCYYVRPSSHGGWTVTFKFEGKIINIRLSSKKEEDIDKEVANAHTNMKLINGTDQVLAIRFLPEYRMADIPGFVNLNHDEAMKFCQKDNSYCVRENSADNYELYLNIGDGKIVHFPLDSKDVKDLKKEIKSCLHSWKLTIEDLKVLNSIDHIKERFNGLKSEDGSIDKKNGINLLEDLVGLNIDQNKIKLSKEYSRFHFSDSSVKEPQISQDMKNEYQYRVEDNDDKMRELEEEISESTFGNIPIQSHDQLQLWKRNEHVGIMTDKKAASLLNKDGDWNICYSYQRGHIFQQLINGKINRIELSSSIQMNNIANYVSQGLAQLKKGG